MKLTLATMLLVSYNQAVNLKYKSDDMDDLIGSIISNKHQPQKESKSKGPVDSMVEDVYA